MFPSGREVAVGEPGGVNDATNVIGLIAEFDQQISHLSFAEVARGTLSFVGKRLGVARASVALLQADGEHFLLFDSTMEVQGVESGKLIPFDSASLGATVERRASIYRPDIRQGTTPNAADTALLAAGLCCTHSVPLLAAGRCIGTMNAAVRTVDGISAVTRQVLQLLAPRLAFAIHVGIAHERLTESEARFRDVFTTVGDGIAVANVATRRLVMVNRSLCTMLGRSEEELLRLTIDAIHPADRLDEVLATFTAMVEGRMDHALEIPILHANGTVLQVDVAARRTSLGGQTCVVGVFRNATMRRQREQEQVQFQKLESIRTLAAGIAHDFNNLLTGLIGNMSLVRSHLARDSEPWELLDEAQRAAFRATALTRQLLTFAKGGSPVRKPTDILQVVRDSANLACSGTNVQCEFELPNQPVHVMGDEGQLAQVIQNVVRNAVEAMPQGGTVRIAICVEPASEVGKGEEVRIELRDHGVGIDPSVMDRVFSPFFTTKANGSGLGLAVAYSIVQSHSGKIRVSSQVGVGTTFLIHLPIGHAAMPSGVTVDSATDRASGRVLIMDDQDVVCRFAERALRGAGYQAYAVPDGAAAIAACRAAAAGGQRFDVIILDLTVPGGMGGREAGAAILAIDPAAKLIVSSGYSEDDVMSDHANHGFQAVLPKPYSASQLIALVEQLVR
jgi:PAS domain S-box-containing protein